MQFCGIICEFNPFHNGHKYIISQAKKQTNMPVVCLMSGDFVQRGTPAIQDKYTRSMDAINNGADCVLELSTVYACSNAENFALGAVRILDRLEATYLAFGVEETSLETLQKMADIKLKNSEDFQNCFKNEIENGTNYNTALKRAIAKEFGNDTALEILSKPNNILAIEYLTAIKKLGSKITPIAIQRIDNGYNSNQENHEFLSASGIREKLKNHEDVSKFSPSTLSNLFTETYQSNFEALSLHKIRSSQPQELAKCYDYSEGIEFRIKKQATIAGSLTELISLVSTARYRQARVQKLLLYPLLGLTKTIENSAKIAKPAVKVLAINKKFKMFLSETKKSKIMLIATNKDYDKLTKTQSKIINIDLVASDIYSTITCTPCNQDKQKGTLFI